MKRKREFLGKVFGGLIISCSFYGGLVYLSLAAAQPDQPSFSYGDYAMALRTVVDDRGMVDYKELKAHPDSLNAFLRAMDKMSPTTYEQWTDVEKIAFWINAYNSLTLKAIMDHYPIRSRWSSSLLYPKNSIRQIKGVWDTLRFPVMGRKLTLDHIEHEILRKRFQEPRIHVALVCAAMSCPPLRQEPFVAEKLDAQFDNQTRRFLQNPKKFRIDRQGSRVYLSPIFKWFGNDFIQTSEPTKTFAAHKRAEGAVLRFISDHTNERDRQYLLEDDYTVKYLSYDWSLNEQKPK